MFFWNSLAFSRIQRMFAIWSLIPLPFLNPAWASGISRFTYCWIWTLSVQTLIIVCACLCKEGHLPSNALPLVVVCKFSLDSKRLMNKREYNSPEGNSLRKWNKFWGRITGETFEVGSAIVMSGHARPSRGHIRNGRSAQGSLALWQKKLHL